MKKNNNIKTLVLVIVVAVVCLVAGGVASYFLLLNKNVTTIVNKSEKEVTVNEQGIADAVEKVYDATVIVEVYESNKLIGTGSGFIFEKDNDVYYVMTNNHVVENGSVVKIILTNNETYETKVVGSDQYLDIAVLSFKSDSDLNVASIGSSENARVGDTVFTVGAPIDSSTYSWTVTRGILSGKNRMVGVSLTNSKVNDYIMKSLQTDATINSGNSGGPLCNSNGEVIGITNMKLVSSSIEGMSLAVPIESAMKYAKRLMMGEDVTRPSLGIQMLDTNLNNSVYSRYNIKVNSSIEKGVVVVNVLDNTSASKAGLKSGDVIVKLNDDTIENIAYLKYYLYQYNIGDKITITVIRNGQEKQIEVTLQKGE